MNKKGTIIPLLYYYSLKMNNTKKIEHIMTTFLFTQKMEVTRIVFDSRYFHFTNIIIDFT